MFGILRTIADKNRPTSFVLMAKQNAMTEFFIRSPKSFELRDHRELALPMV
jgi:hypothetical protein